MTGNLDHVDEFVRSYVSAPVQERIAFIQTDRFIHHPLTAAIRLRLDDLLAHPRSLRMPSLLIYGQPGSGKTSLLADYLQDHPQEHAPNNAVVMRVLYTEMSPGPDQFKLYSGLMHQIGAPLGRRSLAAQEQRTLVFLERAGVRMIIVDEVQHILSGKPTQQRVVLNTLQVPVEQADGDDRGRWNRGRPGRSLDRSGGCQPVPVRGPGSTRSEIPGKRVA